MEIDETIEREIKEIKPNQFMALAKIYTDQDFLFNSFTLRDIMSELKCSKPTATRVLSVLREKNLIREVRDFIVFYYAVKDKYRASMIRRCVFSRIGIF